MNSGNIRVGIIGAGNNTRKLHIPLLAQIEGVRVVAVANRSTDSARAAARLFGIARATDRWEDLIADPSIDAICIGAWPYLHAPASMAALEAGKHVLCEARMACNAAEARAMLATAERHPDLVAQIVPSPFTLAIDDTVRAMIDGGGIGALLAVEAAYTDAGFCDPGAPLTWRQDDRLSGLNALSLGIRYEALMRWTGPAACVGAVSLISAPFRRDAGGSLREVRIPDHIDLVGRLENGAALNMRISAVTGLSPRDETRLYGTEGTIVISGTPATVSIARAGDGDFRQVAIPAPPRDALANGWRVEREFIDAIRGVAPVRRTTFTDGVRYMEFTEAVHRSAAGKQFVDLPLKPIKGGSCKTSVSERRQRPAALQLAEKRPIPAMEGRGPPRPLRFCKSLKGKNNVKDRRQESRP